jgi:hypothetical protein
MATDFTLSQGDTADGRAGKRNQKPLLRGRKGWKGFVHGYGDWLKATEDEGRWDAVDWGKDGEKSGAKEIVKEGNKIIYKY